MESHVRPRALGSELTGEEIRVANRLVTMPAEAPEMDKAVLREMVADLLLHAAANKNPRPTNQGHSLRLRPSQGPLWRRPRSYPPRLMPSLP